jgi:hypothetical protein
MAFTTTIPVAFTSLKTKLDALVGVVPAAGYAALKAIVVGEGTPSDAAHPFLSMRIIHAFKVGTLDGNDEWQVELKLRLMLDALDDTHTQAFVYQTQVENQIQAWLRPDGVVGFEVAEWTSSGGTGHRGVTFTNECVRTGSVFVTRGAN